MFKISLKIVLLLLVLNTAKGQHYTIRFILNDTFQSVKKNFKDSALKALKIEAEILSSQEFKDSLLNHTFSCKNKTVSDCDCDNENKNCNEQDRISGLNVYNSLMKDSIVIIKLIIKRAGFSKRYFSKSFGSSCPCLNYTTTYNWWLSNNILPMTYNYASHLAHEYTHISGYIHGDQPLSDDAAYTVGNIVENILKRRLGY